MTYPEFMSDLPIVCVDFDGVLAESTWPSPSIGRAIPAGLDLVEHYFAAGAEVRILTARPPSHWPLIWKWLEKFGLEGLVYDVSNVKPPASLYFDDRAWRFPLD